MAKKRVHELAKQYDMPTQEVVKRLAAYGIEVKAAATAVDEKLADAALTGKPKPKDGANGAKKPAQPVIQQRAGFGHGTARAPRPQNLAPKPPREDGDDQSRPPAQQRNGGSQPPRGDQQRGSGGAGGAGGGQRQRPTRSSLQGERAPGAAGGGRRAGIGPQAPPRPGGRPGGRGPGGGPGGGP